MSERSRHLSRVIHADPETVYAYVVDPTHLPRWAAGLAGGEVSRAGDAVMVDSPMGRVEVRFVARNELGVADHDVTLPSGVTVTNPLRVLAHRDGAEVVFTLRQADMTDEELERDAGMVERDLDTLKDILEAGG